MMKIFLSVSTAGRHGSGLKGNLRYLSRYIQNQLDLAEFQSSFDQLWLNLAYPPMYVLPGLLNLATKFEVYYDSFPYFRLNRKFKKIDITLQAPEFSEHMDKEEQSKYVDLFEIKPEYKNLAEDALGKILIDKLSEANAIISSKLKKGDVYDGEVFKEVLKEAKQKITLDFLKIINDNQVQEVLEETLNRAIKLREKRQLVNLPKSTLIRDLRVYYPGLPLKALYPYDYIYSEVFLNLLARAGLKCPTYHHLYILVAKTKEDALRNSIVKEDWFVNGVAVLDFDRYIKLSDREKETAVIDLIIEGLKDIALLDQLDMDLIDKVVQQISISGMDTELVLRTVENSKYELQITYFSRSMEEECPVFFNLTDKTLKISKRKLIGKADKMQLHYWMQQVSLTSNQIKVKSSESIEGKVWTKGKPSSLEFEIADFFNR